MLKALTPRERCGLWLLLIPGLILYAWNLGSGRLWQDEAQTALLAQTVLDFGVPRGFDGVNYFSQELGAEYGPNFLWIWHTWLPFYLLAPVLKVFGASTWAARLPFALAGLGAAYALFFLARRLFADRRVAWFALILMLTCVPFLLLARQCRYYSLAALFSILLLLGYLWLTDRRKGGMALFILSGALLFHTQYVYLPPLLAISGLHLLLFHRFAWRRYALCVLCLLPFIVPWLFWFSQMKYGQQYGASMFSPAFFLFNLRGFANDLARFVWPGWFWAAPVVWAGRFVVAKKGADKIGADGEGLFLLAGAMIFTLAGLGAVAPYPFFRYLAPVLPLALLLGAVFLGWLGRLHGLLAGVALALLISQWPLREFKHELRHPYRGPVDGIVEYLQAHAKTGDVVAITYDDLPVKFYTGLRVVGGLTGEDLTPATNADWIIIRQHVICLKDQKVREFLERGMNTNRYEKIVLTNFPDAPYQNRETPHEHRFRSPQGFPPVVIWRRNSCN